MNHIALKTLHVSLLLVGAALFLGGCGPENLDDPSYLAQLGDNHIAANEESQKDADAMGASHAPAAVVPVKAAVAVAPVVAAPAVAVVPPVAVKQLPDVHVKLPPRFAPKPDILTASGEQRGIFQNRYFHRDIFVPQKTLNTHTIHTATTINDKFQDRVIEQPSFGNRIVHTASAAKTVEVLPTLHAVAPAVNLGTIVGPPVIGAIPGPIGGPCARYFGGGFRRYCAGPPVPAIAPIP